MQLDLELKFGALELVDFFGKRIASDSNTRGGFVYEVDGGVGL